MILFSYPNFYSYRLKVLNVNHITYDSGIYQLLEKNQLNASDFVIVFNICMFGCSGIETTKICLALLTDTLLKTITGSR